MYRKNNRFGRGGNRGGGGFNQRGGFGGRRSFRQKTFDPSTLVKKATPGMPVEEYVAKYNFSDFAISEKLKQNIARRGYKTPTPIQDETIPQLLEGRDLVGIARTGTGKTAAFLIPLIDKVIKNPRERVLILTPTRELAVQIRDELAQFSEGLGIRSVICIGGASIRPQAEALRRNPQFVIGTPGRLQDLEDQRRLNFADFGNIVLDEVDRMLDMGFVNEVKYIVSGLPEKRQSLFFSATMPQNVQSIMNGLLRNPVTVSVRASEPSSNVDQDVIRLNGKPKIEVLHDMLIQREFSKVLIFGRTKFGIEKLSRELLDRGFRAASIHGNKSQNQRQNALNDFKNNRVQILLATDVASRGLDINDVTHVINYELPESYEDYIHRIGRTGRANKKGVALTFIG